MKKFLLSFLCAIMAVSCSIFASENIKTENRTISLKIASEILNIDDNINVMDSPAYISKYGYTMLPVRSVGEALGSDNIHIDWYPEKNKVVIIDGLKTIDLTIGSDIMYINGIKYNMGAVAEISKDRIFIPLRDLCHAFDITDDNIIWNEKEQSIKVIKEYKFIDYDEINSIAKEFLNENSNQLFINDNSVSYNEGSKVYIDIEDYITKNIDDKFDVFDYTITETNENEKGVNILNFNSKNSGKDTYKIICVYNTVKVIEIIN